MFVHTVTQALKFEKKTIGNFLVKDKAKRLNLLMKIGKIDNIFYQI